MRRPMHESCIVNFPHTPLGKDLVDQLSAVHAARDAGGVDGVPRTLPTKFYTGLCSHVTPCVVHKVVPSFLNGHLGARGLK